MTLRDSAAIIVAAGAGTRFGSAVPKQFLTLNGSPVFLWSVRAFRRTGLFSQIIVVVPASRLKRMEPQARRHAFMLAPGGVERYDSVRAGLALLDPHIKYVAIHDGARPLVSPRAIADGLAAARRKGASVVAVPARDTVKYSRRAGVVSETIPRSAVWLAQTPQTFRRSIIERAYARRPRRVTDDAQVVEAMGLPVAIVPGDHSNIKITDRNDLAIAHVLLRKGASHK